MRIPFTSKREAAPAPAQPAVSRREMRAGEIMRSLTRAERIGDLSVFDVAPKLAE